MQKSMQLIHIDRPRPGSALVHWPARVTVVAQLIHRIRTQGNAARMMTGNSRASKCMGVSLTESSSSLSSTSSAESSEGATLSSSTQHNQKIDGLRVDSTYGNDRLHREGSKSGVAGSAYSPPFPNSSSSTFPRLPAVPLLTEKQKQLLLRYLCISNDETSRMLIQAAARQQYGCYPQSTVREAPTAAVAGFRTAPRDSGRQRNDGVTAGAAAGGSRDAAVITKLETAAVRRLGVSSGRRAATLAPWSSPASSFATASTSLSKNNFNSAAASRAASNAFTVADAQLQERGVDCWTAAADVRSFQQPQLQPERHHQQHVNSSVGSQPQHSSDLHECEEELRRQEHQQQQPKKKKEEVQQGEKKGQEQQEQQPEPRNTAALSQNQVPCVQRGTAPEKCVPVPVCPLRPCLRRRSTVRFRSPVAIDLSAKEQQSDESIATASEKALAELHACPSKEARQDASAGVNPVVVSSNEREKASFCCPSAPPSSSCLSSCCSTTGQVLDVPRASNPPSGDSSGAFRREVFKRGSTTCHTQPLRCCCCCPGPAPSETVPHICGRPCCCLLDSLENDERTAAPAAPRRVTRATAPPVPLSAQEVPLPATTTEIAAAAAANVPCRYHCDTKKAAPRCCPFCCKCTRRTSSQQEVIYCCCGTCYPQPFRVNEAVLTSSKDEHEETSTYYKCAAGPLRCRVSCSSAMSSVSAEDKGEPTACTKDGRQEPENKGGASGASRQRGASGSGRAASRAQAPAARQHCSTYYPSHEDEGPRPCCGPGTGEKGTETVLQPLLQRVYYKEGQDKEDEEAEEGYCCYACCGCSNRQHACASHSFSQIRSFVADNNMRQNGKFHKRSKTCAHSATAMYTALRDGPSASAAAEQNEETAAALAGDDNPTSQFPTQCIHVCGDPVQQQQHQQQLQQHPQRQQHQQQHQQHRVSEGFCGHMAAQWHQIGKKPGRRCVCSRLPLAASAADDPPVSCADCPLCVATESLSQCWLSSANAAQDSPKQTKQPSAHKQHQQHPRQGSVLQGQMHVQQGHQRAQIQQQAQGQHSPGLHADLQQRPQGRCQQQPEYWCHHATLAGPTELPSQTQQQQVLHNHFSAAFDGTCNSSSFLQRRCLSDLQADNAALDTVASAAVRGLHTTPSTAPTLDSVTPSPPPETPALPASRVRATKEANSVQAGELSKSELCPRGECTRPAAVGERASATRTLTRATITSAGAMPATAAVQKTPLTRGKAAAQPRGMSDHAAAAASAAGANTTLLLEGFLWKEAGPSAPTRQSFAGGAPPLTRKAIDALPANGSNPGNFPSAGAAAAAAENVHARSFYRGTLKLATEVVQLPLSVNTDENIGAGGDFTERSFYKEKEGHVASGPTLSTRVTTAIGPSGSSSGTVSSSARGAATEHCAATSAVGRVANSTGASAAHGPALWCNAPLEEEQNLQQLLRRQQQELAEQLRRLDLLDKRQEELQQPQLQRRQEWWQRLHALEQQLQRRKATLDQQRRQHGLESLSNTPQQQLFQITRQQQQSLMDRSGTNAKFALECKKQRRWINEHHHQLGDDEVQEYQEQQRRGSGELLLGDQWKGHIQEGPKGNTLPLLVKSASLVNSSTAVLSDGTRQEFSSFETNCPAAPGSLLVVSKSTRKFQPPQSVQQHHHHQHRYLQTEGRRQQRGLSVKWPTRQKGSLNARSRMVSSGGQTSGYVCSTGAPCFTVESEQLLLDEGEEEEQELFELQEISQALQGADL